jgi:hypothetical protein
VCQINFRKSITILAEKLKCKKIIDALNSKAFHEVTAENAIGVLLLEKSDQIMKKKAEWLLQHYSEDVLCLVALEKQSEIIKENLDAFFSLIKNQETLTITEDHLLIVVLKVIKLLKKQYPCLNIDSFTFSTIKFENISFKVLKNLYISDIASTSNLEKFLEHKLAKEKGRPKYAIDYGYRCIFKPIENSIIKISHTFESIDIERNSISVKFSPEVPTSLIYLTFTHPVRL